MVEVHKGRRGVVDRRQTIRELGVRASSVRPTTFGALLLVLMLSGIPAGSAQSGSGGGGTQGGTRQLQQQPFPARTDPYTGDLYDSMMTARRVRVLNMERQKEMVAAANKLLRLARELNAEVGTQRSKELTPEQLHKVAEIEKLARSVKERMTSAVGQPQTMMPPPIVVYPSVN